MILVLKLEQQNNVSCSFGCPLPTIMSDGKPIEDIFAHEIVYVNCHIIITVLTSLHQSAHYFCVGIGKNYSNFDEGKP